MEGAFTRRSLLRGAAGAGLAGLVPASLLGEVMAGLLAGCDAPSTTSVFDAHQQAVIREATARLVPGPGDDPAEAGHPGAREADVTRYIVTMIGAMDYHPVRVFAGGPFSDRAGHVGDEMAAFLQPNPALLANWRKRLEALRTAYVGGIAALDRSARRRGAADFPGLAAAAKDAVLASNPATPGLPAGYAGFTDLLFEHAIEGMYAVPEYGGNAGLVGWTDIGFPGDVQPRGYTDAEVSAPLDREPFSPGPAATKVLDLLSATAPRPLAAGER